MGYGLRKNIQMESKISYRLSDQIYLSLGGKYNIYQKNNFDMTNYNFFENNNERNIYFNIGYINSPKKLIKNNSKIKINLTNINKTIDINSPKELIKNNNENNINLKDINKTTDIFFDKINLRKYALEIAKKSDKLNL